MNTGVDLGVRAMTLGYNLTDFRVGPNITKTGAANGFGLALDARPMMGFGHRGTSVNAFFNLRIVNWWLDGDTTFIEATEESTNANTRNISKRGDTFMFKFGAGLEARQNIGRVQFAIGTIVGIDTGGTNTSNRPVDCALARQSLLCRKLTKEAYARIAINLPRARSRW